MSATDPVRTSRFPLVSACGAVLAFSLLIPLNGCIVAGYSSGSGVWIWPGSLVITFVLVLLYFLMRHR